MMRRRMARGVLVVASLYGAPAILPAGAAERPSFNLMELTITSLEDALASHKVTCRQVVQFYLDRITAYDHDPSQINAIQTVNPEALSEADELDREAAAGKKPGGLHCVPVLIKDSIETAGLRTTYGSILFKDFTPKQDATIVVRIRQAEDDTGRPGFRLRRHDGRYHAQPL
jgi:amidase